MRLIRIYLAVCRLGLARWHGDRREAHLAAVERYLEGVTHE